MVSWQNCVTWQAALWPFVVYGIRDFLPLENSGFWLIWFEWALCRHFMLLWPNFFGHWKLIISNFISPYNKKILSKKLHFLPLFWFLIKTFDLFYPPLWILDSLDPTNRVKEFLESKVQPFCLLEQTLFSMHLCVFIHKLVANNEP